MPIATAPPVFIPPPLPDAELAETLLPLVVSLAVGFSVGIAGIGAMEALPGTVELLGGAGGDTTVVEELVEGTEVGGSGTVEVEGGGEFITGGVLDSELGGGEVTFGGEDELSGGFATGAGGVGTSLGGGGEFETAGGGGGDAAGIVGDA